MKKLMKAKKAQESSAGVMTIVKIVLVLLGLGIGLYLLIKAAAYLFRIK